MTLGVDTNFHFTIVIVCNHPPLLNLANSTLISEARHNIDYFDRLDNLASYSRLLGIGTPTR